MACPLEYDPHIAHELFYCKPRLLQSFDWLIFRSMIIGTPILADR
ncbi:unnamed protein product, partial [Onchocerca ochengi]|uniref:Glycosyl transferase n=1 Tax=Onchocerca ochengi TaxID=42157 RepID=A0A182EYB9_ONCOC